MIDGTSVQRTFRKRVSKDPPPLSTIQSCGCICGCPRASVEAVSEVEAPGENLCGREAVSCRCPERLHGKLYVEGFAFKKTKNILRGL
jgi:hypothetical protein